ncbi:MAG: uridine kinase family protein, partial [Desulfotomaculales bacterium]
MIAGPSSSGKTTFVQRLATQLRVNGIHPVPLSLDNYFVDREKTPRDENGQYDYECLDAIDRPLFNDHLSKLIQGEEVELPYFNFKTGRREFRGEVLRLKETDLIIIEGIHGLNDLLTGSIPMGRKFKIYVSALTQLNLDAHNRIRTTDLRLLRRIVRDHR